MLNTTFLFVFALLKENSCVESGGFCRVVDVEKCRAVTEKLLCHNGVKLFLKVEFHLYSKVFSQDITIVYRFKLIIQMGKNQ